MDMLNPDIIDAITEIDETINDLENQKEILKSIDWNNPIDEKTWHILCQTSLRSSDLLAVLVKNTFPEAENILVHCNYVYFKLYGYQIQIPTSMDLGINIDTGWYITNDTPDVYMLNHESRVDTYFKAKDSGASWKELADIQYQDYRKVFRRLIWLFKKKDRFNEKDRKDANDFQERKQRQIEKYHAERKKMKEKALFLREKLLPELEKFSTIHKAFNGQQSCSVEEIIQKEL